MTDCLIPMTALLYPDALSFVTIERDGEVSHEEAATKFPVVTQTDG